MGPSVKIGEYGAGAALRRPCVRTRGAVKGSVGSGGIVGP